MNWCGLDLRFGLFIGNREVEVAAILVSRKPRQGGGEALEDCSMSRTLMGICTCLVLVAGAFSSGAHAAEVVGNLTDRKGDGAKGARVTVTCDGFEQSVFVAAVTGQYRVKNVPDNAECVLVIHYEGADSAPYSFVTTTERTRYNRRIRRVGNSVEFL